MSEFSSGPPKGSLISALVQMERVNSIRDPVAQGTLGLRLFAAKHEEESREVKRALGNFITFCDKFIEAVDYEKAAQEKNVALADELQKRILRDPGTFTAVFSIFDKGSRVRLYPQIQKTRGTVTTIVDGKQPPERAVTDSLNVIKHLYKEIVARTINQERTAEKIIRGRAAIL